MTARDPPVVDGHNDTLLRCHEGDRTLLERGEDGHLDVPRARDGGLAAGAFAVFVPNPETELSSTETEDGYRVSPPPCVRTDHARGVVREMVAALHRAAAESDALRVVRTPGDLRACLDGEALGAVLHFEGAEALAADLSDLDYYRALGLRSLGLAWSRDTRFAGGVPFRYPSSPDVGTGLTAAGERLVAACNDRGVVVDCAHLPERGFWDVAAVTSDPLVVSHAGAHELAPASRNLTDDQLDAVADSGGLVGVTFGVSQVRADGRHDPDTPLSAVADHVAYVADRVGVEHVALGSDFDGTTLPDALGDVTGLPRLLDALRDRGITGSALDAVTHENWLRVYEATW